MVDKRRRPSDDAPASSDSLRLAAWHQMDMRRILRPIFYFFTFFVYIYSISLDFNELERNDAPSFTNLINILIKQLYNYLIKLSH